MQKNNYPHCPKRRADVTVRLLEGEVVVLDRRTGLIHQLNRTASYIWNHCDGRSPVNDISAQLAQTFDVDANTATQDTVTLIRQFDNVGLLESFDAMLALRG